MDELILSPNEAKSLGESEIADIVGNSVDVTNLLHPNYSKEYNYWHKWRLTYESGDEFLIEYLEKFSEREGDDDFNRRKEVSYVPAFAKAAVNDVKDAIFQRIADVTRTSGSKSYNDAVKGKNGGIDKAGTTMNSFVGTTILPELLTMKKIGIFVDMPTLPGETLEDQQGKFPYIYHYKAEDILNWNTNLENNKQFKTLLLRDYVYKINEYTGLPKEIEERYRYMWVRGNNVLTQFFDKDSHPIDRFGQQGIDVTVLNLAEIPFVLFEITDSLLRDVANYQIALLNLASSDIAYALNSNFPFYVEQFDPRVDNLYRRPTGHEKVHTGQDSVSIVQSGERDDSIAAKNYEIEVGTMTGRRVPKGLELPRYIHPSAEPLNASMAKQEELKKDIRMLVKLAVANLSPKMASAESKSFDERSLEAGLSAIGLELEQGERRIAYFWQRYENPKGSPPTVKYPQKYSLQTDKDQRDEAKELADSVKNIPSLTYKREAMKVAAGKRLGSKISLDTLKTIENEIDKADVIFYDPEELSRDVELTLIDPETASRAKGYPEGSVQKAQEAHAERVKRIAESQAKARGASDLSGLENVSREEKMNKDDELVASKKTRGEAK